MKQSTALILSGFIKAMKEDSVGWFDDVIGKTTYEVFRLIECPEDILNDPKPKENKIKK